MSVGFIGGARPQGPQLGSAAKPSSRLPEFLVFSAGVKAVSLHSFPRSKNSYYGS